MGGSRRLLVAVSAIAIVLSGCGATSPGPGASCVQRLLVGDGAVYVPAAVQPADVEAGEPVPSAAYAGCSDSLVGSADQPTDAWRARGIEGDHVVTLSLCATAAPGTSAAEGCDPDAPRYLLWVRATGSS